MSTSDKAYKARLAQAERQQRVRDAAPQMLEALKVALPAVEAAEDGEAACAGRPNYWTEELETVRAAIRAAEGD